MTSPERRFTRTHEWIRLEGRRATVGLSDHAQKEITDVVYVEMPKTGKSLKAGDEATTLESVKAAFSIYAPVSGTIAGANAALEKDPGWVNRSPYDQGWLFTLDVSNPAEFDTLLTEAQYEEFLKSEAPAGHH